MPQIAGMGEQNILILSEVKRLRALILTTFLLRLLKILPIMLLFGYQPFYPIQLHGNILKELLQISLKFGDKWIYRSALEKHLARSDVFDMSRMSLVSYVIE